MRQYRAQPDSRGRLEGQVRARARGRALQWAKREYPETWRALYWVATQECPGYPPQKIRNRAEVLLLSWVRTVHSHEWGLFLDSAWLDVGGTRPGGAPRSGSRRNT